MGVINKERKKAALLKAMKVITDRAAIASPPRRDDKSKLHASSDLHNKFIALNRISGFVHKWPSLKDMFEVARKCYC